MSNVFSTTNSDIDFPFEKGLSSENKTANGQSKYRVVSVDYRISGWISSQSFSTEIW